MQTRDTDFLVIGSGLKPSGGLSEKADVRASCVPLYAVTDPKNDTVEFLGTGTLFKFRGQHLLVTAAHVVDNGKRFILLVAGPENPLCLNRSCLVTPTRNGMTRQTDPLDFCVQKLTNQEAKIISTRCRFIDWEKEALLDVPERPYCHKIMGYPETHNNPSLDGQTLPVNALRVDVIEDRKAIRHAHAPDYKEHPEWYIALRYDPRNLEKQPTSPKVPTFHGFSGGPIWRTDGHMMLGFGGIVTEAVPSRRTGEWIVYGVRAAAIDDLLNHWTQKGNI